MYRCMYACDRYKMKGARERQRFSPRQTPDHCHAQHIMRKLLRFAVVGVRTNREKVGSRSFSQRTIANQKPRRSLWFEGSGWVPEGSVGGCTKGAKDNVF